VSAVDLVKSFSRVEGFSVCSVRVDYVVHYVDNYTLASSQSGRNHYLAEHYGYVNESWDIT
jgi:hypothetical protein